MKAKKIYFNKKTSFRFASCRQIAPLLNHLVTTRTHWLIYEQMEMVRFSVLKK